MTHKCVYASQYISVADLSLPLDKVLIITCAL